MPKCDLGNQVFINGLRGSLLGSNPTLILHQKECRRPICAHIFKDHILCKLEENQHMMTDGGLFISSIR
jgi:hypothetical protein